MTNNFLRPTEKKSTGLTSVRTGPREKEGKRDLPSQKEKRAGEKRSFLSISKCRLDRPEKN